MENGEHEYTPLTGQFPPRSTSIESFLTDGTDRAFRQMVNTLINISTLVLRHRDCCGSYLGVSGPQYLMVATIAQSPTVTVKELARQLDVSPSFVTVEVNKLIKMQIVEKKQNTLDRRSVLLDLTTKGRRLLVQLGPVREKSNDLMYRSLTGDQAQVLQDIMDRLVADAKFALVELERSNGFADRTKPVIGNRLRMLSL